MKRKFLGILLSVIMVVAAFSACSKKDDNVANDPKNTGGSKTEDKKDSSDKASDDEKLVIGFSQCVMNHPFRIAMVDSFREAAKNYDNIEILVTEGDGDVNTEIANIESLIQRGADAIIVSSLSGKAIYPAYQQIADAGIPLIIAASGAPDDDSIPYTSFVSTDEVVMGETAADYCASLLGEKGKLVILRGVVESTNSALRYEGFIPSIEKYPDIEIVAEQSGEWLRLKAMEVMTNILQANPEIDLVYSENDEMALGAMEAIKDAGRENEIVIVSMDGQPDAMEEIKNGGMFKMTIFNESNTAVALESAIKAAKGEAVDKRIYLEAPVIDINNVDEYLN